MSDHEHHHGHCAHSEIQMEKFFLFIIAGGLLVFATALSRWFGIEDTDTIGKLPAAVGAIMLGIPMVLAAMKELKRGRPSSSSLAALAIVAAIANLEFVAAGLLAFILLVVEQFLDRTAFGAQRAIEELVELTPDKARVVVDGNEVERGLEHVSVGDTVRVRPGENLPVDGRVSSGKSSMNMASLTGESAPVEVEEGAEVYAGTTNLTGVIDIEVTRLGGETAIGKVSHLISQAESAKTQRQLLIEQVASFFVPVALAVAGTTWFIMSVNDETRPHAALTAVSVLVVTCPAALVISSPTAMVAAFAAAARLGVMIKDSRHLETMANLDAVVMDKTGTITTGEFKVSRLAPAPGVEGAALLAAAANGEQHSNHPLAQSILKTAREARVEIDGSKDYEEIHGRGVRARTSLGAICVGRASWVREEFPELAPQMAEVESKIEGMS
ncbi:MAG: cation-translocating P-type ATPase, partial [Phycisphaerales bacterium]|nr:cation-translocating P-type ATPase [Phycisphaerales bacterium]